MVEPRASHLVVAVDAESGKGLAGVDGNGGAEELRVADEVEGQRELPGADRRVEPEPAPVAFVVGSVLPSIGPIDAPEETERGRAHAHAVRDGETPRRKGAERSADLGPLRGFFREDLHHSGEGRDPVKSPLRTLDDLDPIDVLDIDLRERRVERPARRNAVDHDQECVELLQTPESDVREPRAVVAAAARIEPDDVLERVGERSGVRPAKLFSRDDRGLARDLGLDLRAARRRHDDMLRDGSRGGLGRRRRSRVLRRADRDPQESQSEQ